MGSLRLNLKSEMLLHILNHMPDRVGEFIHATADLGVIEAVARGLLLIEERPYSNEDSGFQNISSVNVF